MRRLLTAFALCAAAGFMLAGTAHAAVTATDINDTGYTDGSSFVKFGGTLTCTANHTWEMSSQVTQGSHRASSTVGERRTCTGNSQNFNNVARIGAKSGNFTTGPANACVKIVDRSPSTVKGGGTATIYDYCENITLANPPA